MWARVVARVRVECCEFWRLPAVAIVVALASGAEFVGDVEGGEDGDAEGVDGVAVGGDGAHLGVDDGGEALDVGGVGAAEIVDLIVDVYGDGLAMD